MSDSSQPHGLQPTRLFRPCDFPGKSTGVGCHFLLQEIFPTQGLNPGLLHCRQMLSVQFSRSVVSNSLWSHELQHTRPPCPSQTPRVYSNSCPSSQWCHPASHPLVYACLVAQSCLTMDPLNCSPPGFLSMGFSRQEYWSGLPFFPSGYLSHPGIEPMSPLLPALQVDSLPAEPSGKLYLVPNKNLVLCL